MFFEQNWIMNHMLGVYIVKMNIQFNEISNLDCFHVIFILDENTTNNILFFELSFDFQLLHSFQMMTLIFICASFSGLT